jgi:regulator of CtrA degradation
MPIHGAATSSSVAVHSLDPLLDDVLTIAGEARAYLLDSRPSPAPGEPVLSPLYEAAELSRVSARLGYCAAWLLARRAVHAGELSVEQAAERRWRLEGQEVCGEDPIGVRPLPPRLSALCERSLAVYRRVERLDQRLDG